jgi:hypothetical protein
VFDNKEYFYVKNEIPEAYNPAKFSDWIVAPPHILAIYK